MQNLVGVADLEWVVGIGVIYIIADGYDRIVVIFLLC